MLRLCTLFIILTIAAVHASQQQTWKSKSNLSRLRDYHLTDIKIRYNSKQDFHAFAPAHAFRTSSLTTSTPSYPDQLQLQLTVPSADTTSTSTITLDLIRNVELFSADYTTSSHTYVDGILTHLETHPQPPLESWHCYYRGQEIHDLALSLCDGISGVIIHNGQRLYIEPAHKHIQNVDAERSSRHIIYTALSDTHDQPMECGIHGTPVDTSLSSHDIHIQSTTSHSSSSSSRHLLQSPSVVYVELLVVNDYQRLRRFTDRQAMEQNTQNIISITNQIYSAMSSTPQVRVVLVGQVTFLNGDPYGRPGCTATGCAAGEVDSSILLSSFSTWDETQTNVNMKHDNAQLLSGYDFESATVGLAAIEAMCRTGRSTSIVQATFEDPAIAATSAHEMGHNWGMIHDGEQSPVAGSNIRNTCDGSSYVMASRSCLSCQTSASKPPSFSTCSTNEFQSYYTSNAMSKGGTVATCVDNVPSISRGAATCGNGVREGNETCDCGSRNCANIDPCCNGATCQLNPGAVCSKLDGCCTDQCTLRPAGYVCRTQTTPCDIPETCSGTSERCPKDHSYGAGYGCPGGVCYAGICRSKNEQCPRMSSFNNGNWKPCELDVEAFVVNEEKKKAEQEGTPFNSTCGRLYCNDQNVGNKQLCSSFPDKSSANAAYPWVRQYDGMPCDSGKQCLGGVCSTTQQLMATTFQWVTSDWTPTTCTCGTRQTRNVTCVDQRAFDAGAVVTPLACAPTDEPSSSRLCVSSSCPGDIQKPTITNCPESKTISSSGADSIKLTWTEPSFKDDDTSPLRIFQNYKSGDTFISDRTYYITYQVSDASGNIATCQFTYTVQKASVGDESGSISVGGLTLEKKYIYIIVGVGGAGIFFCCLAYYCCSGPNNRRPSAYRANQNAAQQKLEQRRMERDYVAAQQAELARYSVASPTKEGH